jgi:hypothetical protein
MVDVQGCSTGWSRAGLDEECKILGRRYNLAPAVTGSCDHHQMIRTEDLAELNAPGTGLLGARNGELCDGRLLVHLRAARVTCVLWGPRDVRRAGEAAA